MAANVCVCLFVLYGFMDFMFMFSVVIRQIAFILLSMLLV